MFRPLNPLQDTYVELGGRKPSGEWSASQAQAQAQAPPPPPPPSYQHDPYYEQYRDDPSLAQTYEYEYPQQPAEPEPVFTPYPLPQHHQPAHEQQHHYEQRQQSRSPPRQSRRSRSPPDRGMGMGGGGLLGDPHSDQEPQPQPPRKGGKGTVLGNLAPVFAAQQQHKRPDGAPPLFSPPTY